MLAIKRIMDRMSGVVVPMNEIEARNKFAAGRTKTEIGNVSAQIGSRIRTPTPTRTGKIQMEKSSGNTFTLRNSTKSSSPGCGCNSRNCS